MDNEPEIQDLLQRMRRDWDKRASEDAQYYVYTRDRGPKEEDFEESGQVSYDQLVRPSLPIFLNGRSPKTCRVVEIGCGVGRMTRWFAEDFLEVHGIDISAEMIAEARQRLRNYSNVVLHVGSGMDLGCLPDRYFDLAFSYIVFQHIPSREVIANYVRETARVLKPGAVFKFQLNGRRFPDYSQREKDTWHGETYSLREATRMVEAAGFAPIFADGVGSQYFLLAARKKAEEAAPLLSCVFPAQPGTEHQLLDGWQGAGETSSRSLEARAQARLALPASQSLAFYLAICFQPLEPFPAQTITITVNGVVVGTGSVRRKGDHYFEWPVPAQALGGCEALVTIEFDPPHRSVDAPAVRSLGIYAPR